MDDQWRWWGYHYGFRRAILGDVNDWSPMDRDGDWCNASMTAQAERYYRRMWDANWETRYVQPPAVAQHIVRDDWRELRSPDLTPAEHEIADPLIATLAQRARENIAAMTAKSRKAFNEDLSTRRPAIEISAPILKASVTPERLTELMSLMDKQQEGTRT